MTPEQFVAKWQANTRGERQASQEHFLDLCALLGEPTPNSDPDGSTYAFEKGATKATGGEGWADVWRRGCFALKDLELLAVTDAEALGLQRAFLEVGPEAVLGIEINPYAAELARVSVWIGHIQWMRRHGLPAPENPVLRALETIECRDAVLAPDGTAAAWPAADAIVGNPPFLGGKRLRSVLGDGYCEQLFATYADRVPGEADLVCYWFERARACLAPLPPESPHDAPSWPGLTRPSVGHAAAAGPDSADGRVKPGHDDGGDGAAETAMARSSTTRVGLVATNSIRGGANRRVLDAIARDATIFEAWSDESWTIEGAAVRVSLVCFAAQPSARVRLDGADVVTIRTDLTADAADLTTARRLPQNAGVAFQGSKKVGPFEITGDVARAWMSLPANPNGRSNAEVLRPSWIGIDVARRPRDVWIIDFTGLTEHEAAFFAAPYAHVVERVKPLRDRNARDSRRQRWWLHGDAQPKMRKATAPLLRYMSTPEVSKHRIFVWTQRPTLPDCKLMVIAQDDDLTFGVLHSRLHELWALATGSWHGVGNDPRYTPTTTFETFPFPDGLTPDIPAAAYADDPRAKAIAEAARALVAARDRWLNPPELVDVVPEVVPGFPDRVLPKTPAAAATLKARTLTNLYNTRGTPAGAWLDHLHRTLDVAVAAAYGFDPGITRDDALARLLALNHARAEG